LPEIQLRDLGDATASPKLFLTPQLLACDGEQYDCTKKQAENL
jgi:hypothetical protein